MHSINGCTLVSAQHGMSFPHQKWTKSATRPFLMEGVFFCIRPLKNVHALVLALYDLDRKKHKLCLNTIIIDKP